MNAGDARIRIAHDSEPSRSQSIELHNTVEQPLNSIEVGYSRGPRVSTRRSDSSDPFAESFDEEEGIVDRFGMSHTAFWDQMPQVYSVEGEVLSSLLAPYVEVARPVQLGVVASYETPAASHEDIAVATSAAIADERMIIIEDDPTPGQSVRRPMSSAYRQEYSQLFAKLRQSL